MGAVLNWLRHYVQAPSKVLVGTTGGTKFSNLLINRVPLESEQRDESIYIIFIFHSAIFKYSTDLSFSFWQPRVAYSPPLHSSNSPYLPLRCAASALSHAPGEGKGEGAVGSISRSGTHICLARAQLCGRVGHRVLWMALCGRDNSQRENDLSIASSLWIFYLFGSLHKLVLSW